MLTSGTGEQVGTNLPTDSSSPCSLPLDLFSSIPPLVPNTVVSIVDAAVAVAIHTSNREAEEQEQEQEQGDRSETDVNTTACPTQVELSVLAANTDVGGTSPLFPNDP